MCGISFPYVHQQINQSEICLPLQRTCPPPTHCLSPVDSKEFPGLQWSAGRSVSSQTRGERNRPSGWVYCLMFGGSRIHFSGPRRAVLWSLRILLIFSSVSPKKCLWRDSTKVTIDLFFHLLQFMLLYSSVRLFTLHLSSSLLSNILTV